MKKIITGMMCTLLLFLFISVSLFASTENVYNIVTCPGEDMSTEMRINWQSKTSFTSLQVDYTLATDTTFANKKSTQGSYVTFNRVSDTSKGIVYSGFTEVRHVWTAELTGLTPKTEYIYRISNGSTNYGEIHHFTTASNTDDEFSFLYMTDPQYYSEAGAVYFNNYAEKHISESGIKFALITGDINDKGGNSDYWDMFYTKSSLKKIPYVTTVGNHEYYDNATKTLDNSIYNQYFNNPKNGPEHVKNSSYYTMYNNTLFIMLDSEETSNLAEQKAWFKDVCNSHTPNYIIVGIHKSMYAGGPYVSDGVLLKQRWQSTFDECGVDLVLSGHDHTYSRTYSLYNDEITNEQYKGTVYILGGYAGQKFYPQTDDTNKAKWAASFSLESSSTVITVGKDALSIKTVGYSGSVKDEATIARKHFGTKVENFTKEAFEKSITVENAFPNLTNGKISWSKDGYGYVASITAVNKNSSKQLGATSIINDLTTSIKVTNGFWIGENNKIEVTVAYRDGTKSVVTLDLDNNIDWGTLSGVKVSNISHDSLTVMWNQDLNVENSSYIYRYRIWRDDRLIKTISPTAEELAKDVFIYDLTNIFNENTRYILKVEAYNSNGTVIWSEEIGIKTTTLDTDDAILQKKMAKTAIAMLFENMKNIFGN